MTMRQRVLILLLCGILATLVVLGCNDWDMDRSGFAATSTASAYKARVLATADAEATQMVEELRRLCDE